MPSEAVALQGGLKVVRWDLTARCNLRCRHCYAAALYPAKGYRELSADEALRLLDNLFIVGVQNLFFYGGEPLLRRDLPQLIARATAHGTQTFVITNGTRLTPALVESLFAAGLGGVAVSLDAASPATYQAMRGGSFEKVVERLRQVVGLGYGLFVLGFVISRYNLPEVEQVLELQQELGIGQLAFTPLAYVGRARQVWPPDVVLSPEELVDLAERVARWTRGRGDGHVTLDFATPPLVEYLNQCFGTHFEADPQQCEPLRSLFVRADGRAFPCKGAVAEMGLKEPGVYESVGIDLLQVPLVEALASEDFGRLFDYANPVKMKANLPFCQECPYLFAGCSPCPISAATPGQSEAEFCHPFPVSQVCRVVRRRITGVEHV